MEKTELNPEGNELYEANLKAGTAFVTEEGKPCTNAEITESLSGKPAEKDSNAVDVSEEDVIALLSPKDRKRAMRKRAREQFIGLLGQAIVHIGFSEALSGKVIAAVGLSGPVETNFAFNPETNAGIIWGYTNGGAISIPMPLENIDMATVVSLENAGSFKMSAGRGTLLSRTAGYWLAAYRVHQTETKATDLPTEPGAAPERGQTEGFLHVDELPWVEGAPSDAELALGKEVVEKLNEGMKAETV